MLWIDLKMILLILSCNVSQVQGLSLIQGMCCGYDINKYEVLIDAYTAEIGSENTCKESAKIVQRECKDSAKIVQRKKCKDSAKKVKKLVIYKDSTKIVQR